MADTQDVPVPDIGDFDSVEVIEVLISPGDAIAPEDSLITLESDKASMEIPSPVGGTVREVKVKVGDSVAEGDVICTVEATDDDSDGGESGPAADEASDDAESTQAATRDSADAKDAADDSGEGEDGKPAAPPTEPTLPEEDAARPGIGPRPSPTAHIDSERQRKAHASPGVRRFARELGVDLLQVEGSGRKGRILHDDVKGFVKKSLSGTNGAGPGVAAMPEIDFSEFGEIETKPLTRINKLTGRNLHRNWVNIPHVTQFDKADITELESFRKQLNDEQKDSGIKVTLVSFLLKASVSALREFPRFNASLDTAGENLILKKYFHIGVAVDTPDGLVVPVIRDVDRKSVNDLAAELMETSQAARDKKLSPKRMQGGCMSISSLGGVGGTAFTPIVNAPEVAILGVSRAAMEPVYRNGEFVPRLMLPISLSYDHRVIDGAEAARFTTFLGRLLSDTRRMLL